MMGKQLPSRNNFRTIQLQCEFDKAKRSNNNEPRCTMANCEVLLFCDHSRGGMVRSVTPHSVHLWYYTGRFSYTINGTDYSIYI